MKISFLRDQPLILFDRKDGSSFREIGWNANIMAELIEKLKREIIEALNLEDLEPEDIDKDAPLFGDGLGLSLPATPVWLLDRFREGEEHHYNLSR
mgnify:CR=1 FL=1